jgi:hypothetical protein
MGTRISITSGASAGSKRRAATHYGTREIEDKLPTKYVGERGEEILEFTFSYDDLPAFGQDEAIYRIPANSRIKEATLTVITAFAGGTSYDIGLEEPDGTDIDVAGIDDDILLAAINAVGETVVCDGALVGNTAGIGTADGQVTMTATGTFTAGKARLRIVYEPLFDRA